ncbi:uncharacterized protein [Macrobrachium rosenbergii]|uniref:uncharacterized protein n=1 Tax=Macrobrachium rosenbergii TaxID=79674 RepID=UPI0034D5366F
MSRVFSLLARLNTLLTPYTPDTYSLKSSAEFLQVLQSAPPGGFITSMDVESLFTNIPVDKTISMIADRVYQDPSVTPLHIPEHILRSLLEICTKKAPFPNHRGHMYLQVDGVAMGSRLGVVFANFYMGTVEQRIFANVCKPPVYVCYIDDTFLNADSQEEIDNLRAAFHQHSSLSFTTEYAENNHFPFLDVLVEQQGTAFSTSVYTKPTNLGLCMNGESKCPEHYKNSVIKAYVCRSLSHCSSWQKTHEELDRATQVLVNNGHKNRDIQDTVMKGLENWYQQEPRPAPPEDIKLFYRGRFHKWYKDNEKALKNIIKEHVTPTDLTKNVQLIIYYASKKTSSLIMKNNPAPQQEPLKKTNMVYRYKCPS